MFTGKFWSHIVNLVVSDEATTNRKLVSELGMTDEKRKITNTFEHPLNNKRKIFMILDAPHLIKNIRNRLYIKKGLKVNKKIVLFYYLIYYQNSFFYRNHQILITLGGHTMWKYIQMI